MQGFNVAEQGHFVNVLPPVSISGGKTGQRFHVKNAGHISIQVQIGVMSATVPTALLVKICQDKNGTGATAIGFRYYKSKGGGTTIDQTSPPVVATSAGITAFDVASNEFILIEIDAAEIDATGDASQTTDYPFIEVSLTDSGNANFFSISAILSGFRYAAQGVNSPTATA